MTGSQAGTDRRRSVPGPEDQSTATVRSDVAGGKLRKDHRMVLMIEDTIEGVPAIHAAPADRMSHPLPTIFFFHGYRSSKELSSFFGYMLATAGFRVILPEAPMHGSRYDGDDAVRLG